MLKKIRSSNNNKYWIIEKKFVKGTSSKKFFKHNRKAVLSKQKKKIVHFLPRYQVKASSSQHLTLLSRLCYPGLSFVNIGHVTWKLGSHWLGQSWQWGGNNGKRDLGQSHTLPSSFQPIRSEDCEALADQKRGDRHSQNILPTRGLGKYVIRLNKSPHNHCSNINNGIPIQS